ncbi:protein boule-like [Pempheris klunzingeri]
MQASGQIKSTPVAGLDSAIPLLTSCGALCLTTSTGYPNTYCDGVSYSHCPNMSPPAHHWPCFPNQYQWNIFESPMPSSPAVYSQQSEHLYHSADGGSVQPPLSVLEGVTPEVQIHHGNSKHVW